MCIIYCTGVLLCGVSFLQKAVINKLQRFL